MGGQRALDVLTSFCGYINKQGIKAVYDELFSSLQEYLGRPSCFQKREHRLPSETNGLGALKYARQPAKQSLVERN